MVSSTMSSCLVIIALNALLVSAAPRLGFSNRVQFYPHLVGGSSCQFEGKLYQSGQAIPRRHTCHNCVCVRGSVQCFWQNCPPPPEGCVEMTYSGICNPSMYNCPIPEAASVTTTSATAANGTGSGVRTLEVAENSSSRPFGYRYFGSRRLDQPAVRGDCVIRGIAYFTGETVGVASNNCLECRCAKNSMYCTPLCCYEKASPEEEDAEKRFRTAGGRRPIDRNPLAHLDGLGMQGGAL